MRSHFSVIDNSSESAIDKPEMLGHLEEVTALKAKCEQDDEKILQEDRKRDEMDVDYQCSQSTGDSWDSSQSTSYSQSSQETISDKDTPIGDDDTPISDNDTPIGDEDTPIGDNDAPLSDDDAPETTTVELQPSPAQSEN
ncbi:hypothetical protein JAAARDRAFT_189036 [Jaapia argillacea MUCL 33604]|uniref:Uncharacterized protein n=1 Tax=Jaapia argillacea MUCL 33604 TaxID=933084 RepID=A0A067QBF9_9AGAM|nr:hypothetical protein JAAARDRAFT_189036 [Jaapia argillacea MUCL 33604]